MDVLLFSKVGRGPYGGIFDDIQVYTWGRGIRAWRGSCEPVGLRGRGSGGDGSVPCLSGVLVPVSGARYCGKQPVAKP